MRKHYLMDHTGHSTVEFDETSKTDLATALERFNQLTSTGHAAATRKAGERDYKVVKDFKDTQDETLFVPAMKGG